MNTYIIAEIGINFNGSLENCYKLIDATAESGCNAAKFQLFSANYMYPKSAGKLDWKDDEKEYSYDIFDAVKSFELPVEWIDQLIDYCNKKEVDFMASVFDIGGLNYMVEKGMKIIKLSSYTITHIPLIEAAAKTGLPLIMSTGGATISEVQNAIETINKYHNKLTILHCSIQYPTALEDVNMGVLDTFDKVFPSVAIGYSDHTAEVSNALVQSIYLGASVVEKHITLDKNMDGPDHFFALEPKELKQMVDDIRSAELDYQSNSFEINKEIFGHTEKICYPHEEYIRNFAYSTLFTNKSILKGDVITVNDISILRPGKKTRGLEPKFLSLFDGYNITAKKDLDFEDPITWESILG